MSKCIVAKFGGTSLQDAEAITRSASIVENNPFTKVVVVSAVAGVTDSLEKICHHLRNGQIEEGKLLRDSIIQKHEEIAKKLDCFGKEPMLLLFKELRNFCEGISLLRDVSFRCRDSILSIGERLSSYIFYHALKKKRENVELFDVRNILLTSDDYGQSVPSVEDIEVLSQKHLAPLVAEGKTIITQGFIGRTYDGSTTTLGRGGSDYSASLLAEAVKAHELHIWTDVEGIMTTDPRITESAETISQINFSEAAELANFGARVLHPVSLWPAIRKDIPVYVASSFYPEGKGTWIRRHTASKSLGIQAIALRQKQVLITIKSIKMLNACGFLTKVFNLLADHGISIDLVTTSEISIALTANRPELITQKILKKLQEFADVKVEEGVSLVSLIGNGIKTNSGIAAKVFQAISDYNIRLICQGASDHNVCFLVDDFVAKRVVQILHQKFALGKNKIIEEVL